MISQNGMRGFSGGGVDLSHIAARSSTASQNAAPASGGYPADSVTGQIVDIPAVVFDVTQHTFQDAAQLSSVVPVVVNLWSSHSPESLELNPTLERLTREFGGRLVLAMVEADSNVELVQAFQVQALPAVVALLNGRPVPLFQGAVTEEQIRDLFQQLVQLAGQQGVTGQVNAPDLDTNGSAEPVEKPVNPAHLPALEALEQGDYATAVSVYEQVLSHAPADSEAKSALVQVRLLHRLEGKAADQVRLNAGQHPDDVEAQLLVADLDISGGHIEDGFLRVLDLYAAVTDSDQRARVKDHLLELFEVVGSADPRVHAARGRLANLLY